MKKVYMTPELEEIKIMTMGMLAISGPMGGSGGGTDDLGFGGDDPGGLDPDAPELPGMPDFSPNKLLGFPF